MGLEKLFKSFAYFYVIVILVLGFWGGIKSHYNVQEGDLRDNENIFQKLSHINLIAGPEKFFKGIFNVFSLKGIVDVIGGIAMVGIGVLQTIGGVVTFPFDIIAVITNFYGILIPAIITEFVGFIIVLSTGLIILSSRIGYDIK